MSRLWNRRDFLKVAGAGAVGLRATGAAAQGGGSAAERTVYLGTYTNGASEGIYICRFDTATGALRRVGATKSVNPTFLTVDPSGRYLYSVNEVNQYEGKPTGAVSAYAVDRGSGALRLIDQQSSGGAGPAYVAVDRGRRFVLIANYAGGSAAVLPVRADGGLEAPRQVIQDTGSGANPRRQEKAHVHSVTLDPAERFALIADLGIDRLLVFHFDDRTGALTPAAEPWAQLPPGTGPRHLAFDPSGRHVYLVGELASNITAFHYDPATGALRGFQTESLLPPDFHGENTAADIHFTPDGRFLYASTRGHDSIAVFSVDRGTGRLTLVQHQPSGGKVPRNFGIDPSGRFLLAAHQSSGGVVTHRIDPATGRLSATGQVADIPSAVCVHFAP
jgi:6-phosphogluconolactonase